MVHCPTCGAGLRFDIPSQQMFCEHCQNSFDPKALYDKVSDDAKTAETFDSYVYVCPSCGAELETTDQNDAVGFCPYCGGASMIYDKIRQEWKPDGVIPFKITKEQCKQLYCDEVKKHLFVSRKFRDPQLIESFRGIYMPYCRFEGTVDGEVTLRAQSPEQSIGNYDYRTDYYDVVGNASFTVSSNITHDTSVAFDDHISERLEPFDKREQRHFTPGYLCGFYAETGDADAEEYRGALHDEMVRSVRTAAQKDPQLKPLLSPDRLQIKSDAEESVPLKMESGKRLLYPIWFMSYRRGDKLTYAAVNGQTGKVSADLPLSPLRILLAALAVSAVLFGALLLLFRFLPSIQAHTVTALSGFLGLTGMYIMQHSYVNTVGKALDADEMTSGLTLDFILSALGLFVSIVLVSTDGSYEQNRAAFGSLLFLPSLFFTLRAHIRQRRSTRVIKRLELNTSSMLSNGILVEAKRFNHLNGVIRGVLYVWMIACLLVGFADGLKGAAMYGMAIAAAVGLTVLSLAHIAFQTRIAHRRPPQFNKKGAAYDEK